MAQRNIQTLSILQQISPDSSGTLKTPRKQMCTEIQNQINVSESFLMKLDEYTQTQHDKDLKLLKFRIKMEQTFIKKLNLLMVEADLSKLLQQHSEQVNLLELDLNFEYVARISELKIENKLDNNSIRSLKNFTQTDDDKTVSSVYTLTKEQESMNNQQLIDSFSSLLVQFLQYQLDISDSVFYEAIPVSTILQPISKSQINIEAQILLVKECLTDFAYMIQEQSKLQNKYMQQIMLFKEILGMYVYLLSNIQNDYYLKQLIKLINDFQQMQLLIINPQIYKLLLDKVKEEYQRESTQNIHLLQEQLSYQLKNNVKEQTISLQMISFEQNFQQHVIQAQSFEAIEQLRKQFIELDSEIKL
ncbi:Hypothetical_protein [Hexamita inflata]|uniref:Hypothetical_protein n=1 Tax=Hexamita inflata TaxID=28002 RepID=A0AA86UUN7_9EUKA|nr:Hypothetical protein HINF_LOCUS37788 [Hexamita inflata]